MSCTQLSADDKTVVADRTAQGIGAHHSAAPCATAQYDETSRRSTARHSTTQHTKPQQRSMPQHSASHGSTHITPHFTGRLGCAGLATLHRCPVGSTSPSSGHRLSWRCCREPAWRERPLLTGTAALLSPLCFSTLFSGVSFTNFFAYNSAKLTLHLLIVMVVWPLSRANCPARIIFPSSGHSLSKRCSKAPAWRERHWLTGNAVLSFLLIVCTVLTHSCKVYRSCCSDQCFNCFNCFDKVGRYPL